MEKRHKKGLNHTYLFEVALDVVYVDNKYIEDFICFHLEKLGIKNVRVKFVKQIKKYNWQNQSLLQ